MNGITSGELASEARGVLATIEGKALTNKDRMALPVQDMPCQDPAVRAHNMEEVAIGYTEAQARVEAATPRRRPASRPPAACSVKTRRAWPAAPFP